jgi:STE24 endopeptidase
MACLLGVIGALFLVSEARAASGLVDLSGLTPDQRDTFAQITSERLSPCGGAETLADSLQKEKPCPEAIARARSLARVLAKNTPRERAELLLEEIDQAQKAPPLSIDLSGIYARGPEQAPIVLVEVADFECPFCGRLEPILQNVIARHPTWVRHYFMNLPIPPLHPHADAAARAALAAGKQGKFWEYHDLLYSRQEQFSEEAFPAWAKELGLDMTRFSADFSSQEIREAVARDVDQALKLGVKGTPRLFINGQPYQDRPTEDALEDALLFAYAKATGDESVIRKDPGRRTRAKERESLSLAFDLGSFALSLAALWLFLRLKLSARLSKFAQARAASPWKQSLVYALAYTLLVSLAALPLSVLGDWWIDQRFGLSNQSMGEWLGEWAIGLAISLLMAGFLLPLLFVAIRRYGRRWWIAAAAAVVPLSVVLVFLAPVVLMPLFNEYQPLPAGPVKERVEALAAAQNIPLEGIYTMDQSRQTSRANAFVTGLGSTKRVVYTDTMLENFSPEEIAFVTGHEFGHYVEHHIWIGLLVGGLGGFLAFFLVGSFSEGLLRKHGAAWGVSELKDPGSLPVIILVGSIVSFLGQPLGNAFSRELEKRADVYGLDLVKNGEIAASAFEKLADQNLANPSPSDLVKWWYYDHPPLQERIDAARSWSE